MGNRGLYKQIFQWILNKKEKRGRPLKTGIMESESRSR